MKTEHVSKKVFKDKSISVSATELPGLTGLRLCTDSFKVLDRQVQGVLGDGSSTKLNTNSKVVSGKTQTLNDKTNDSHGAFAESRILEAAPNTKSPDKSNKNIGSVHVEENQPVGIWPKDGRASTTLTSIDSTKTKKKITQPQPILSSFPKLEEQVKAKKHQEEWIKVQASSNTKYKSVAVKKSKTKPIPVDTLLPDEDRQAQVVDKLNATSKDMPEKIQKLNETFHKTEVSHSVDAEFKPNEAASNLVRNDKSKKNMGKNSKTQSTKTDTHISNSKVYSNFFC